MRNIVIFSVFLMCAITNLPAQEQINVQNGTKSEFYTDLETAIQQAAAGDTIYLPGRVIRVQNDLNIGKKLTIIGAGWDTDSVGGLSITEILRGSTGNTHANVSFGTGSDGSMITGCYVQTINIGYMNAYNQPQQIVSNVTIWRNVTLGTISLGVADNDGVNNKVTQIYIRENVIASTLTGHYASDCFIYNNLCGNISNFSNNTIIYNNVINGYIQYLIYCTVENNFINSTNIAGSTYSNFNNNAFAGSVTFPNGTNEGSNNLNQTSQQTFEVNNLALPKYLTIRADSPCKNAGTDGTDIGMYGGMTPYKPGALPINPHIDQVYVAGHTDKDGKINVNIQASAQTY